MLKQKTNIKFGLIMAALTVTFLGGIMPASATVVYGQTCSLAVFPYNPNASGNTLGSALNPYINFLSGSQCTAHLTYPNAYTPQPPLEADNAIKAGSETIRGPIALHEHGYFNDKNHTDSPGLYYVKSFVDKFEITIENDGYTNLNTASISCVNPVPAGYAGNASAIEDCQGTVTDLWGGTTVSKTTTTEDGKSVIKITWDFATVSPNVGRPQIYGNNGAAFTTYWDDGTVRGVYNLTDPYNRLLNFGVNLPTNDKGQIWSTTTTSRVLIGDLGLKKTNYPANFTKGCINNDVNDLASGWCYKTPSAAYTAETVSSNGVNRPYYWYPIGVVGTVWKKPPPTPACNSITLDKNGPFTESQLPQTINVIPSTTGDLTLDYKWTASNSGSFIKFDQTTYSGSPYYDVNTATILDKLKALTGPITVTVTAVNRTNHSQEFTGACQKTITINPAPPPSCQSLTITNPDMFNFVVPAINGTPLTTTFTVSSSPVAGANLKYKWETTSATAKFNGQASPYTNQTTSVIYTDTNPHDNDKITVTAVDASGNILDASKCKQVVTIYVPPQTNLCVNLNPVPVQQPIYPGATIPVSGSPVYNPTVPSSSIIWSETGNGYFLNDPNSPNPAACGEASYVATSKAHSANTTFTAGSDCKYLYVAGNPGDTVTMEASENNPFVAACKVTYTVQQPPVKPVCTAITLSPNALVAPGNTPLSASVTYSDGQSYSTQVTWSQTNGSLVPPLVQEHASSQLFTNSYTTAATTGSVSAKVTKVDPAVDNSTACQNGVTVNQQPARPYCVAVNLTPNILNATGNTALNATVTYSDGQSHNTDVIWTPVNGNLQKTNEQHVSGPLASLYNYQNSFTPNNTFGGSVSVKANVLDANVDNSATCQSGITVNQQPEAPYCVNLDLQPATLSSGSTVLSAHVTFSNNQDYDTSVQWNGSNGAFNDSTQKTQNSISDFQNIFTISNTESSANASAAVTGVPGNPAITNFANCNDSVTYSPPQKVCRDIEVTVNGEDICATASGDYDGKFTFVFDGEEQNPTYSCLRIPEDTQWRVYATDEPDNRLCQDNGRTPRIPPPPPSLIKEVSRSGSDAWTSILSVTTNQYNVDYRLIFSPSVPNTSATISDPIGRGIRGYTYGDAGEQEGGTITYDDHMTIEERGYGELRECGIPVEDTRPEHCYNGTNPGRLELVEIDNPVTIKYSGIIRPKLTSESCKEGTFCQEKFTNDTYADWIVSDEEGTPIAFSEEPLHDFATVQIFCQYILTRAAGDIFLETDLNAGVDIRKCSKYTTTPGLIVVPAPPEKPTIPSTGTSSIFSIEHEICSEGQAGTLASELKSYYGQTVSGLSSQICEVKLKPGTAWQQKSITNTIEENKTRISRWDADYQGQNVNMSTIKINPDYAGKKVFHVKGGDLTIDQEYTLSDGDGAKTFIVEDGDLIINEDIKYGSCIKEPCTVSDIASLAFIVLNGNVIVKDTVSEMSGVYFVQEGDSKDGIAKNGQLLNNPNVPSFTQLFIYGSIYGDIQPLFLNRVFAGDPALGGAGIVVRFDERVILNTPPGLRDVLSFSQGEVAR